MLEDTRPIICDFPDNEFVDIYFIHDLHYGNELYNPKRFAELCKLIDEDKDSYICWIGDLMENAVPNSKSDVFSQKYPPQTQKEYITEVLTKYKDRTLAVVSGNHESNRTTKLTGLFPLYDCCLLAGIGDKYRENFAFVDIGIGNTRGSTNKRTRYVGQIQHKAKDIKSANSADYTDGIDFFAFGHDHEAINHPRAKLVYDMHNKVVRKKNVEVINCGSFLNYGGYGARAGYRPQSDKMFCLRLYGNIRDKRMTTLGFYV